MAPDPISTQSSGQAREGAPGSVGTATPGSRGKGIENEIAGTPGKAGPPPAPPGNVGALGTVGTATVGNVGSGSDNERDGSPGRAGRAGGDGTDGNATAGSAGSGSETAIGGNAHAVT